MSSGGRNIVTNPRERAVSPDLNRLQQFASSDLAEILRFMIDARTTFEVGAGGVENIGGALNSPLRGVVLAGLRPRPDIGSVNLFIEPGVAIVSSPDVAPNPDDSSYKYAVDPGVQLAGSLTFTPNPAGSRRIDVIECQPTDELVETATREIFDITAGGFNPALVEKVRRRRMTYRIRLGTAGAGYPGSAVGWLPLAVSSAAAGATDWDDCIVWDVRPLLADFEFAPQQISRQLANVGKQHVSTEAVPVAAPSVEMRLRGQVEVYLGGFLAGGVLNQDADIGWIDILDSDNQAGGGAFLASRPWYVWACFPHALPRWCRYTPATSGQRIPGPLRGIPVVAAIGASTMNGLPVFPGITLPPVLGLGGGPTFSAVMLVAGLCSPDPAEPFGIEVDGHVTRHVFFPGTATVTEAPTVVTGDRATYTLVDGIDVPANARAVWVRFSFEITMLMVGGGIQHRVEVFDITNTYELFRMELPPNMTGTIADPAQNLVVYNWDVRVPLQSTVGQLGLYSRVVRWFHQANSSTGATVANDAMQVLGWELGP